MEVDPPVQPTAAQPEAGTDAEPSKAEAPAPAPAPAMDNPQVYNTLLSAPAQTCFCSQPGSLGLGLSETYTVLIAKGGLFYAQG